MYSIYQFTLPALMWAMVIWRAPSAFGGTRASRFLWGFLAAIAVALTTRPPEVDHLIRSLTGSPDLSVLIKHLAALASNYCVVEYVIAVHGRGPRRAAAAWLRLLFVAAAALALTVLFVFFFEHDPGAPPTRVTDAHLGDPAVRLYEGIVYVYLGTATALSAKLFWSNRRSVPAGLLRAGVVCMAGGGAMGFVYTLYRVVFLAGQESRPDVPGRGTPDALGEILPAMSLLLIVVGVGLPPLRTLVRYVGDQYALWRLHPLWSDLLHAVPSVAFGPRIGRTRDLFVAGDRTLDVAHRAFEIRDACLVLRDRSAATGAERPAEAADEAPGGGVPTARAEAEWLFSALHEEPDHGRAAAPPPADSRTPAEEVAWLLKVAAAYGQLPRGGATAIPRQAGAGGRPPGGQPSSGHGQEYGRKGGQEVR
ncbi:MAB_1171c family putative transporter [Streptomyces sp. NPDC001581]|uniref:MAB_1171c family putative transporter n=1 Tax=Streptomyces sp. NPDC001581 TaxID=3154386 RepID=UPI003333C69B